MAFGPVCGPTGTVIETGSSKPAKKTETVTVVGAVARSNRKWLLVVGMLQVTVAKGSSCTIIGRMLVPATVPVGKPKLAAVAVNVEPLLLIKVSSTISRPFGLLLEVSGAIGRYTSLPLP